MEESKVLTVSGLVTILSEIEQLKGLNISVTEGDDNICISIGDATYCIQSPQDSVVEVDNDVVDIVEEIDNFGWDDLDDEVITDVVDEPDDLIEGGILKELVKTLAIGGLVRLTKSALKDA